LVKPRQSPANIFGKAVYRSTDLQPIPVAALIIAEDEFFIVNVSKQMTKGKITYIIIVMP
jgi:hypothetical protein